MYIVSIALHTRGWGWETGIDGTMASMLNLSVVDRGFEPRSVQI